ncbi:MULTISPECIES: Gfo/Idh/MocA family protein [Caldilinea]|jgi:predicted dehydrogenase|uniref:Putative oxidoreductase n=1 Tax=Caldilinea aerophila (strain DSM 14535 / JCM 11387 / NBRC 104270 / STL-6-O1) TaxID=926550 RepID=I0I5N0_CALAS|nr:MULTISPECIES: Gfo/Idh/MocA family oxidoreductase [Caldilinea]MBO9392244.1 Gfo/Idh/MocA family oxidoreductase [Caldilinea sp.]BAM00568.1 putative oxidoreductase [Caldilinea aerophila DSM 14535 = NBRC 104270]GIV71922.1 MAG: oxidoreductase [Caldilinea sp.]
MAEGAGFTSMAAAAAEGQAPEIGVGMLGYAFMGKAHSNAFKKIPYMMYPPPAIPKLVAICGRNEEATRAAAVRFGYERYYTDWRALVEDEAVQLFDNGGPNDAHAEPCIAAAQAGKHILCEKPLARTAEEAKTMLDAVQKAGVKHMVAFNYRFVPAVRQMRLLIESGALGRIYHFRAVYLQEWIMPHYNMPMIWRLNKQVAGSGALGDLGAHIIDLGRYLVGEIESVSAMTRTFIKERPWPDGTMGTVDVDDAFAAVVSFANGALGTVEATRFAAGRKNSNVIEINGEKGSLRFNLERLNELEVYWVDEEPKETRGFHQVLVSEPYHPWWENWWPQGHIIGWEHTFVHEITHLLDCIVNDKPVAPIGADFEDGYRCAVICDAILESAETKRQVDCKY